MSKSKLLVLSLIIIDVLLILFLLVHGKNIQLLNSKGIISVGERNLIYTAGVLMLGALIPVFILTAYIARKFRSNNTKAQYSPHTGSRVWIQVLWWVFPSIIIIIFAAITWKATHLLDPYRPIQSSKKPIVIEVVALRWKWLFIYPEENIATVNFVEFPVNTPVNFKLTADAPMNSFWIPQLSGQMYAMAGMSTQLHIAATSAGDYSGRAAEINGQGFSDMEFKVRAVSDSDYKAWLALFKKINNPIDFKVYEKLTLPSESNPQAFYYPVEKGLYNKIMQKYLPPQEDGMHMNHE